MGRAREAPVEQVGGKAAALARLAAAGVRVPRFFVVTSAALEAGDDSLEREVLSAYSALQAEAGHGVVAVRSSAAAEDSAAASFAGRFTSLLGVSGGPALLQAIARVRASAASGDAAAYRAARGVSEAPAGFAVLVQAQIFARRAGVLFTRHPLEPDGDLAYLEANFGTGETVVGGLVTPDYFTISRGTGKVVESRIGSKKRTSVVSEDEPGSRVVETDPARRALPSLDTAEAEQVAGTGLQIEALMGQPQDIEWAIDGRGLWILQSRPLTGPGR